jgi:hypothetical protein
MRLSLLLKREPFGRILEDTLSSYWSETESNSVRVRWGAKNVGAQVWHGNVYLNFFCVDGVDPACFDVIVREFGHAKVAWRRGVQAAYVRLATRPPARRWLSQVSFSVSSPIGNAKEILVIGGNRRLRIIHPRAGRSVVIHKANYTRIPFEREIAARTGPAAQVAPRFFGVNADGSAFEEEYFVGSPANRLPQAQESDVRRFAQDLLVEQVHQPTLRVVVLGEYLCAVARRIATIEPSLADVARRLADDIARSVGQAPLGLAFSHGDFQDANILVGQGGVRVIDWEASEERSQLYDLATLQSGLRLAPDRCSAWRVLAERWLSESAQFPSLLVPAEGVLSMVGHAALWWLEDILLRCEEARMLANVAGQSAETNFNDFTVLQDFLKAHSIS